MCKQLDDVEIAFLRSQRLKEIECAQYQEEKKQQHDYCPKCLSLQRLRLALPFKIFLK